MSTSSNMVPCVSGRPTRFLVVGCGSIGKRHLGNLLTLHAGSVRAFDVRPERRQEVQSRFGIDAVDNLEAVWSEPPDVVLITAPTSLHVPLALKAAQAGCHLFIEKPLANQRAGVAPLVQAVRERRLISLVGCNLRFHPGLQRLRKLLQDRAIGRVVAARVEVGQYLPDWHPQEDYRQGYSARQELGGGVILDAIHELDYIRWLLGEVVTVACFSGQLSHLAIETEDTAALLLRFAEGAIGEVHLDYVQRAYSRTCHLIGDEGTLRWDYSARQVRLYSAVTRQWQVFDDDAGWEPNQMYVDELQHFLRCLAGEEQPMQDVFAAARVLDIALAAKQSAASGQVITLDP